MVSSCNRPPAPPSTFIPAFRASLIPSRAAACSAFFLLVTSQRSVTGAFLYICRAGQIDRWVDVQARKEGKRGMSRYCMYARTDPSPKQSPALQPALARGPSACHSSSGPHPQRLPLPASPVLGRRSHSHSAAAPSRRLCVSPWPLFHRPVHCRERHILWKSGRLVATRPRAGEWA